MITLIKNNLMANKILLINDIIKDVNYVNIAGTENTFLLDDL